METEYINKLIEKLEENNLDLSINLDRPIYIQPEDRILYRSFRILLILGYLNTKTGLSKEVIACMDFLLRNPGYQKKFIIEYYKHSNNLLFNKLNDYSPNSIIEIDFNIVQYKSVPWDLRYNDMFLYLFVRDLVDFIGQKPNLRVTLSEGGLSLLNKIIEEEVFLEEQNFLELFGKRLQEEKAIQIITEVIPNSYWKENEKFNYQ